MSLTGTPTHSPLSEAADTISGMSSTLPSQGALRSAADVQADIAVLMRETGGWLWGPTRVRYERLRDEWVAAVRDGIVEAA